MKIPKHGQARLRSGQFEALRFLSQPFPFDIYLSQDFNIYARMTAATPACPYRVMPQFLPEWEGEGFWLEARRDDQPIFSIAGRMISGHVKDWVSEWPGHFNELNTNTLQGKLFFNGGQWISADSRGQGYSPLTCKLLHAIALLQYDFDHIFALVIPEMHGGGDTIKEDSLSWRQGFRSCVPGITWTGYYPEPQHLSLISMTRQQAVQSLSIPDSNVLCEQSEMLAHP